MADHILRMSLAHAATLPVAARAIADTAGGLGLRGAERTQLEALLSEALTAVIADSFDGADAIDVDVDVRHEPGSIEVILQQHGAPSSYVSGQLPVRLETLISLGYADSMRFTSDGVRGSQLRIVRTISAGALIDDAGFVAETSGAAEPVCDLADITIRLISPDDVIGVARLYFRVYGYTKIGSPWIYEPDVFRDRLARGQHEAVVALTPTGRIVGHSGILRAGPDARTAAGGPLAVDPAYRRIGLSDLMGASLIQHILGLRLDGVYSEAVTAHPASQKTALRLGAREVGLILGRQPAELDFLGFDGPRGFRRAVMVLYSLLSDPSPGPAYPPARYRDIVGEIYQGCGLSREVVSDPGRAPTDLPAESRFATELTAVTRFARITVEEYGADFVAALHGLLQRFEREQFDVIVVHLPLASPLTAHFGAGLSELGLSFNAVFPGQGTGDELVLGICRSDQDPETIATASDFGVRLRDFVIADRDRVIASRDVRARSRASMARILEAL